MGVQETIMDAVYDFTKATGKLAKSIYLGIEETDLLKSYDTPLNTQ